MKEQAINIISYWVYWEEILWPYIGLISGVLTYLAILIRHQSTRNFLLISTTLLISCEIASYFILPELIKSLTKNYFHLPETRLYGLGGFFIGGMAFSFALIRYCTPALEQMKSFLTKNSKLERNLKTDIRYISSYLPNPQKYYDPEKFFNIKKGTFFGLNENRKPTYLPITCCRSSHMQFTGTTGSGKGIAAGVMLTQAIQQGEAVIVVDPKNDEFLPHVLYKAANNAQVPYIYIDLLSDIPAWNPLSKKTAFEGEELLSVGFDIGEKGTDADYYRLNDRCAARSFAGLCANKSITLIEALRSFLSQFPEIAEKGDKFTSDIEEIALMPITNIRKGLDISSALENGAVIYVRGSMRNPRVKKLQRMFVLSVMQHIENRDRDKARHVCMFLDEFKYLISRPTMEAIGAIRDKNAHVILAYQSVGDLYDCPDDMSPESIRSSINENCSIKLTYRVHDPDTAKWIAEMSGTILVDDELRHMRTNAGLAEVKGGERTLRQTERPLIDTNMLKGLAERCAVLYGQGLPQFVFISPIFVEKVPAATRTFTNTGPSTDSSTSISLTNLAEELVDVD